MTPTDVYYQFLCILSFYIVVWIAPFIDMWRERPKCEYCCRAFVRVERLLVHEAYECVRKIGDTR